MDADAAPSALIRHVGWIMNRLFGTAALGLIILTPTPGGRAVPAGQPAAGYDPRSTEATPCGVGTPARGQFPREIALAGRGHRLTLTVRQDGQRLCYVADGVAEAPLIRLRQGEDFSITLRNEITDPSAIDKFVPTGTLDAANPAIPAAPGYYPVVPGMHHAATGATNLHLHGFSVPPRVPADEVMKTCVDPAPGPAVGAKVCGRREFTYRYHVPATMPAGLYWYHPHVHGEVQAQMLMGLSGAIVVEGPDDDARRAAGIAERVFIVRQGQDLDLNRMLGSQAALDAAAVRASGAKTDDRPEAAAATPAKASAGDSIDTSHEVACSDNTGVDEITLNGARVVDGHVKDADLAHVPMPAGSTQLWRVLNAATDAYLNLGVIDQRGMPVPLRIVARDGAPLTDDSGRRLNKPPVTGYQLVPPSGRLEFLVPAPPAGEKAYFVTKAVDTGCSGDRVPERRLALVTGAPAEVAPVAVPQSADRPEAKPLPDLFSGLLARKTDRTRVIALAEYPRPGAQDQTDFYIVERKPGAVLRPFEMGGAPAFTTTAGSVEEWEVENWTNEIHAFHIHQVHFRLLSVNGTAEADPPLLDVVNVPRASGPDVTSEKGAVVPGRVRIKLAFPEELAGDIPFHCHLVDHEDNGMMAFVRVLPPKATRLGQDTTARARAWSLDNPPICRPRQRETAS
jgi:FtsP/CotA-like multicopper oxidase with cupredoxin domain